MPVPQVWRMQWSRNPNFVGRADELAAAGAVHRRGGDGGGIAAGGAGLRWGGQDPVGGGVRLPVRQRLRVGVGGCPPSNQNSWCLGWQSSPCSSVWRRPVKRNSSAAAAVEV